MLEGTPDEPVPEGAARAPEPVGSGEGERVGEPRPAYRAIPMRDRAGRREQALAMAGAGTTWTSRAYAEHFGISQGTAWQDLKALVAEGALATEGARKNRRYVSVGRTEDAEGEDGPE